MPDTDSYDSSSTNENLAQASQRTAEAAEQQKQQNAAGDSNQKGIFGGKKKDDTADKSQTPAKSGGLIGAIKDDFKKGGTVPATGNYHLHKDEEVLPKARASEYRKVFTKRGQEGKHKWGAND